MIPGRYCEAKILVSATGREIDVMVLCMRPATGVWDYGCVHEHVLTGKATCDEHEPREGDVGCVQCWRAGHDCKMTFRPATVGT